jgi:hypothetical protein
MGKLIFLINMVKTANSIFMNKIVGDFIPLEEMNELKNLVETLGK